MPTNHNPHCKDELTIIHSRSWTLCLHFWLKQFLAHCRCEYLLHSTALLPKFEDKVKEGRAVKKLISMGKESHKTISFKLQIYKGVWFFSHNSNYLLKHLFLALFQVLTVAHVPKHNILILCLFFFLISLFEITSFIQKNASFIVVRAILENTTLTIEQLTHTQRKK